MKDIWEWRSWFTGNHGARCTMAFFPIPRLRGPGRGGHRRLSQSAGRRHCGLGGGTGFLLSQLAAQGIGAAATLVNVDCSKAQLALANQAGLAHVRTPIQAFRRSDVATAEQRLLLMMRSCCTTSGKTVLRPLLRHLRAQVRKAEFFVHQSASFDHEEESGVPQCALPTHAHRQVVPHGARLDETFWRPPGGA